MLKMKIVDIYSQMRDPKSRLSKSFSLGLLCLLLLLFLVFFIHVVWNRGTSVSASDSASDSASASDEEDGLYNGFRSWYNQPLLEGIDDTCTSDDPVAASQKNAGNISLLDDRVTKLEQQEVDMSNNLTNVMANMDTLNQQMTALAQSQTDAASSSVNAANTSLTTDTTTTT